MYKADDLIVLLIGVLVSLLVFVIIAADSGQSECLERGYPDAYVSLSLNTYCINVDGSITGIVKKLQEK